MTIYVPFPFNLFLAPKKNYYFHFSIWSCAKTTYCSGNHLGYLIHTKKLKFCKGSSDDSSCTVWVQSISLFLIKKLFIFLKGPMLKLCLAVVAILHFPIDIKNTNFVKDHARNIWQSLLSDHLVASDKNNLKHFPLGSCVKYVLHWWPSWISDLQKSLVF